MRAALFACECRDARQLPLQRLTAFLSRTMLLHVFSYELDKEKVTDGRSGPKHCMVSLRNPGCLDGLVLTTSMPTAQGQMHLVETRQLLDKGHVHAQARERKIHLTEKEGFGAMQQLTTI